MSTQHTSDHQRQTLPTAALAIACTVLLGCWTAQGLAAPVNGSTRAEQGEQIAEAICTTCHRVPDEGGNPIGPPFVDLAQQGDWTASQLQQVLNAEQHEEAVPASQLQLDALAQYLDRLDR